MTTTAPLHVSRYSGAIAGQAWSVCVVTDRAGTRGWIVAGLRPARLVHQIGTEWYADGQWAASPEDLAAKLTDQN